MPDIVARRRSFALGILLVSGLTLLSGILQGRSCNRWGLPVAMRAAAAKLAEMPAQFGDWQLHSQETLDQATLDILEGASCFAPRYVNAKTGELVDVLLFAGPQGPLCVHTPEICYPSHQYTVQAAKRRVQAPGAEGAADQFWGITFRSLSVSGGLERVCYAWSTGKAWSAPDEPRFAYAGEACLYKIQVSSSLPPGASPDAPDPCLAFLRDFVPMAGHYLIAASAH